MHRLKTEKPRGVLKTTTVDPGRYRHVRYHPSGDLAPYVEHYWSVEWDLRGLAPERVETLPHPSVHMIFEHSGACRVTGVSRRRFSRLLEGQGGIIAAKFTPGGFRPFVQIDIRTLTDRTVTLRELFGNEGDAATRPVLAGRDDACRIAAIEDFLRRRKPVADDQAVRVAVIVYAIAADRTIVKVEDLVTRYGVNVRALQRLFAKYIGVSPKWVIRRYRLHEAAEQLGANVSISQSDLALSLGYSDQAHFTRDFTSVVGTSPAAYGRRARR